MKSKVFSILNNFLCLPFSMPVFVFSSQQSYQCKESFSIFEETEETVIYNAHLVNQVHIKPLELFEVFILVPGFNVFFTDSFFILLERNCYEAKLLGIKQDQAFRPHVLN